MSTIIPKIGIMQGRLSEPVNNQIQSFPHNTWETEFEKAHNCGFQVLEWIFDDLENPILNDSQIEKIKSLSSEYDIEINSIEATKCSCSLILRAYCFTNTLLFNFNRIMC